jgi:hypothetical protein
MTKLAKKARNERRKFEVISWFPSLCFFKSQLVPLHLVQDFRGHITVLHELEVRDYLRILQQPSNNDMEAFILRGEKATWPHIEVGLYRFNPVYP